MDNKAGQDLQRCSVSGMATTKMKSLTAGDLLRLYSQGVRGELIRGVLCETMAAGVEHGTIAMMTLGPVISLYVRSRRLGRVIGSDSGVWLARDPDTVREPDIAYISADRLPLDVRVIGYLEVVPELVVEIISPSDTQREVNDKTRMWLSYGVSIVWEIYPADRAVMAHRSDGSSIILNEDDTLDGGDVLPGFSCPVRDIFDL